MTAAPQDQSRPPRTTRRTLVAAAVILLAVLAILVAGRTLIAQALATSWLQSLGVAAQVDVRSLTLTGAQARLRLGALPDATVDELDVGYGLDGPWNGRDLGVTVRSVRLVRPRLALRWDGRQLSYGGLTRLVQVLSARPANPNVPPPRVLVEAGRLDLATPYGALAISGDGSLDGGALTSLQATLAPAHLAFGGASLVTPGGPISLRRQGATLALTAHAPVEMTARGAQVGSGQLTLTGALPYPRGGAIAGPVMLAAALTADRLQLGGGTLVQSEGRVRFDGAADGRTVTGRARATLTAAGAQSGEAAVRAASVSVDADTLTFAFGPGGVSVEGQGRLTFAGTDLRGRGLRAAGVSADVGLARAHWVSGDQGRWDLAGQGQARLTGAAGAGFSFADLRLGAAGRASPAALAVTLSVRGQGSADASTARRYAAALTPADPAYAAALQRAARAFAIQAPALALTGAPGRAQLTATAPVRLTSTSGAVLTVHSTGGPLLVAADGAVNGGLAAELGGGGLPALRLSAPAWRTDGGITTARLTVSGTLNLGPVEAAALQNATGDLRLGGGAARLILAGCTPLAARSARFGETTAAGLAVRLCPAPAPLVEAGGGRWRTAGRFEAARGALPSMQLDLSGGGGRFDVAGGARGGAAGSFDLDTARLADTTAEPRFNPLIARGGAVVAGNRLTGRFTAAQPASGLILASMTVEHDLARGEGHAVVQSHGLTFSKGGLQPGAISPLAAIARDTQGAVDFDGRFDWTAGRMTSSGRLRTDGLAFSSPLGQVKGTRVDVRFTSLAPLVTAPGQSLTVASIDGVVPMTDLSAAFTLTADAASLDSASALTAKGRLSLEPMRLAFAGDGTVRGAVLLDHVDLGELLASSSLADSVKMQMVVVGRLPFEARPPKLSFLQGHISAVQPGRISISRAALSGVNTGAPGSSTGAAVNAVQDLAYDALENLAFDTLEADVASRPGGRLGLIFRIKGRYDPPVKQGASFPIADLLNGTAFQKKIPLPSETPINLNLDTSLNFDELMQALTDIWKRDERKARNSAAVQTPAG
ncbi:intermembrane phospholipid transport protein YdbH family protein [Caulobacter sp. KR2-114]|uniref:intermembrane phospholipid transport protein YdbH family protein n=1 Tax=Caulobacter sp. KR2-114 TaxID=3400912 RepID=UPI003C07F36C